jgi:hypothetical protein
MLCRIFETFLVVAGVAKGVGMCRSDAPGAALLHVTCGGRGPDRTGAIEGLEGVVSGHVVYALQCQYGDGWG